MFALDMNTMSRRYRPQRCVKKRTLAIHEPLMNHPVPLLTQTCQEPSPLGNRFCALFGPKESGDEAVTSGDMLGGLEFAAFPGRKRKTEQSVVWSPLSTENLRIPLAV